MAVKTHAPLKDRLLRNVEETPGGCWQWSGYLMPNGYGYISLGQQGMVDYIHRVSYKIFVGDLADGLVIDHLCRNRACCNPEHLEAVTQKVNVERGLGHGSETHCPHGHPYDETNTRVRKCGRRACRRCENAARARRKAVG